MKSTIKIHETAFVIATFRASNEALSKDKYSIYWKNPKTDKWIENFLDKVSKDEPFTHCLRNRYFYETIKRLIDANEIEVLVNFGCGFSMYPYLFKKDLIHVEIDQKDIIHHKKNEVERLVKEGKLPERKIHYIAKDFNLEKEELETELKSIIGNKRSFVLLEGVIFFLSKTITNELIELIGNVQTSDSYLGAVSYLDSIEDTDCFKRLINFFSEEIMVDGKFEYLTLPTSYYESLTSYALIEQEDYVSLSKQYSPNNKIQNGDLVLNEQLYLLKRM